MQSDWSNWLGQIGRKPGSSSFNVTSWLIERGQQDKSRLRQCSIALDCTRKGEAIHTWQVEIKHDDGVRCSVPARALHQRQSLFSSRYLIGLQAPSFKITLDDLTTGWAIIHDQRT